MSGTATAQIPLSIPPRRRAFNPGRSLPARGEPMIWLTGSSLCICLVMVLALLSLVVWQGIGTFWPGGVVEVRKHGGRSLMGEVARQEEFEPSEAAVLNIADADIRSRAQTALDAGGGRTERRLIRTGNFDVTGTHFTWVSDFEIASEDTPQWATVVERLAWGRFYGTPTAFEIAGERIAATPEQTWQEFEKHHGHVRNRWRERHVIESRDVNQVNGRLEEARLELKSAEMRYGQGSPEWQRAEAASNDVEAWATGEISRLTDQLDLLKAENARYAIIMLTADGREVRLAVEEVVRAYQPNRLSFYGKAGVYLSRWWEFLSDEPREANSEGGVFPAIFGTALMTLLMSIAVVPFGVLAALYLREYAKPGPLVSAVRIAINNLAGVPSIVFGVFGLGFFCYGVGSFIDSGPTSSWSRGEWFGGIAVLVVLVLAAVAGGLMLPRRVNADSTSMRWLRRLVALCWVAAVATIILLLVNSPFFDGFYRARLPNPTFGKGAMIWASLTLALLTLPVVIVATEEALAAVPGSMREGSYACGGSKWQTIRSIVLPRAMPGIMTGMILAMGRGAGEVAPLMLVGAVKWAPQLPVAAEWPFGMNRSFMHLGFHIYDLGFQSQNSEAAKPMVYTTTLLLILLIAALNLTAIWMRARLRRKFVGNQF